MTALTHQRPGASNFDRRLQMADLAALFASEHEARAMAENYVGVPY